MRRPSRSVDECTRFGRRRRRSPRHGSIAGDSDQSRSACSARSRQPARTRVAAGAFTRWGPRKTRDLWLVSRFYCNQNDRPRSFSRRFNELTGREPDKPYATTYVAVERFSWIIEASDTIDGMALNLGLRREPVYLSGANGRIRVNATGADVGSFRVKPTDRVAVLWDYHEQIRTIPATDSYRRLTQGACSMQP